MSNMVQEFLDTINLVSTENIKSTPIDVTVEATVFSQFNVDTGEYKVEYQGNIFSAFSQDPLVVYQKGEVIYVLVPQGDYSRKKIIIGKVTGEAASFANRSLMTNHYIDGEKWSAWYSYDKTYGICAVAKEERSNLVSNEAYWEDIGYLTKPEVPAAGQTDYPTGFPTISELSTKSEDFQRHSKGYDFIYISADFKTGFENIHSVGRYMLRVECFVGDYDGDESQGNYKIVTYELGFGSFAGAPYNYGQWTPNKAYFNIGDGVLKGLHKVSLMQDGNFVTDLTPTYENGLIIQDAANKVYNNNNIKCQNFEIGFARKVDLSDNLYHCWITAPGGAELREGSGGVGEAILESFLFYGYQDITNSEHTNIYWFREQADFTVFEGAESDKYGKTPFDYSGPGWKLISSINDEGIDSLAKYREDRNKLAIPIQAVPYGWRYKVVMEYNGTVMSAIKEVRNKSSEYELSIEQTTSLDGSSTQLKIVDANDLDREWFGTWWLDLPDGSYTKISSDYHYGGFDIKDYLNTPLATFRVECFDPDMVGDTNNKAQVDPVTYLSYDLIDAEESDLLIEWIGKDTFTYDALGARKPWVGDGDNTIFPRLKWKEGKGTNYRLEILDPNGVPLGGKNDKGQGRSIEDSMLDQMWVDFEGVIHFKVKDKFDINKTKNTFTVNLIIFKDGKEIGLKKEIYLFKDGQQGTQGSEWMAPIKPCVWYNDGTNLIPSFTDEAQGLTPLVLTKGTGTDLTEDARYKVCLRPFIKKNGVPLESLPAEDGYYYTVHWDVRFPNSATDPDLRNASWLRLKNPTTNALLDDSSVSIKKQGHGEDLGLVAKTAYYRDSTLNYGAVKIGFHNQLNNEFVKGNYCFSVKATINIYRDGITNKEGSGEKVATINSFYPVDLLLDYDNSILTDVEINKINTNWPRFVSYNATGYDPVVSEEKLMFRYGDNAFSVHNPSKSYKPDNLTLPLQEIDEIRGEYYYRPKSHYFWQDGTNGAIGTHPSENPFNGNKWFIRTIIFHLNNYGNVDINTWDGQGIDINEDDGTIFAPTVGAGYKDPLTNTFTGIVMGIDKSQLKAGSKYRGRLSRGSNNILEDGLYRPGYEENPLNKFMTGLYGYQDGYSSFGIMENGTAFFGRADHGGRFIMDGYNATIYGGGNGRLSTPYIGDPMWNTMRLNFVDLTHAVDEYDPNDPTTNLINPHTIKPNSVAAVETDDVHLGFRGHYFGDPTQRGRNRMPVWMQWIWQRAFIKGYNQLPYYLQDNWNIGNLIEDVNGVNTNNIPFNVNYWTGVGLQPTDTMTEDKLGTQLSGFGPNRASTTPAIEIGQHREGLMPGLLHWNEFEKVFKDLHIPGNRNFMVTYDGTLWAMNGVFMGTIIGSNILGGRIQGGEIGIGKPHSEYQRFKFKVLNNTFGNWKQLLPPAQNEITVKYGETYSHYEDTDLSVPPTSFYVDNNGNTHVRSVQVYGGRIDIGSFHLRDNVFKNGTSDDEGYLYMGGYSDFVGPTHFYGNVGIGPSLNSGSGGIQGSNEGNLYQTLGRVGLGISFSTNETDSNHGLTEKNGTSRRNLGKMAGITNYSIREQASTYYLLKPYSGTTPTVINNINIMGKPYNGRKALETISFFGVDSNKSDLQSTNESWKRDLKGHFYPMHFRYRQDDPLTSPGEQWNPDPREIVAYMTTMDIFKAPPYFLMGSSNESVYRASYSQSISKTNPDYCFDANGNYYGRFMPEGSNYFRVGLYGTELTTLLVRKKWQHQDRQTPVTGRYYYGMMGKINRFNDSSLQEEAFGLESWARVPIVLASDGNIGIRSRDDIFISAKNTIIPGADYSNNLATLNNVSTVTDPITGQQVEPHAMSFKMQYNSNKKINEISLRAASGEESTTQTNHGDKADIQIGILRPSSDYHYQGPVGHTPINMGTINVLAGLTMNSTDYNWGLTLFHKRSESRLYSRKRVHIGCFVDEKNAADKGQISGSFIGQTIGSNSQVGFFGAWANPDNQHHIYARFG